MKAHVRHAPEDVARMLGQNVMDAQPHLVAFEDSEHFRIEPAGFAKLNDMRVIARQLSTKLIEPRGVLLPARRQLIEQGAEVFSEPADPIEEALERFFRPRELEIVGQKPIALGREDETRWGLGLEGFEGFWPPEPVEGVVDFDRVEVATVVLEPLYLWQPGGIKPLAPMWINPTRCADADRALHG